MLRNINFVIQNEGMDPEQNRYEETRSFSFLDISSDIINTELLIRMQKEKEVIFAIKKRKITILGTSYKRSKISITPNHHARKISKGSVGRRRKSYIFLFRILTFFNDQHKWRKYRSELAMIRKSNLKIYIVRKDSWNRQGNHLSTFQVRNCKQNRVQERSLYVKYVKSMENKAVRVLPFFWPIFDKLIGNISR